MHPPPRAVPCGTDQRWRRGSCGVADKCSLWLIVILTIILVIMVFLVIYV
jgi:hypothetical protein